MEPLILVIVLQAIILFVIFVTGIFLKKRYGRSISDEWVYKIFNYTQAIISITLLISLFFILAK